MKYLLLLEQRQQYKNKLAEQRTTLVKRCSVKLINPFHYNFINSYDITNIRKFHYHISWFP